MEVYNNFPSGNICPVCGTNIDAQTLMVPVDNSKKNDGLSIETIPTHLVCILDNIRYSKNHKLMGLEANKE